MRLFLANEAPSVNIIDLRNAIMPANDLVIIAQSDYQAALFYSAMTGALTVAGLVCAALAFAILVRECARFNSPIQ